MSNETVTISAAVPANVKAEAAAVAAAHGMSMAALLRELLARVAALAAPGRAYAASDCRTASRAWRKSSRVAWPVSAW